MFWHLLKTPFILNIQGKGYWFVNTKRWQKKQIEINWQTRRHIIHTYIIIQIGQFNTEDSFIMIINSFIEIIGSYFLYKVHYCNRHNVEIQTIFLLLDGMLIWASHYYIYIIVVIVLVLFIFKNLECDLYEDQILDQFVQDLSHKWQLWSKISFFKRKTKTCLFFLSKRNAPVFSIVRKCGIRNGWNEHLQFGLRL